MAQLDLTYAPQFGSAKDAVHIAAFVAQNQLDGVSSAIAPGELKAQPVKQLIDVRSPAEHAAGTLVGAVNIPVDLLREQMSTLDKTAETVVFCAVGQRGHVAQRILAQNGFTNVKNLKGGYSMVRDWPGK
ncbi:MAG: rhodanese-like domain-containing protein [Tepidisphaeraceae bacterium]